MKEQIVVVEGALCRCIFGSIPDRLRVLSQKKEYANNNKLIGTTLELGATFENNCFGPCPKLGIIPPPCRVMVTGWVDFYPKVTISNGGKILVENSRAICAAAGVPCIEVIWHGQVEEPALHNFRNADPETLRLLNPLSDPEEMTKKKRKHTGLEFNGKTI
jgi:hypothetical protein